MNVCISKNVEVKNWLSTFNSQAKNYCCCLQNSRQIDKRKEKFRSQSKNCLLIKSLSEMRSRTVQRAHSLLGKHFFIAVEKESPAMLHLAANL